MHNRCREILNDPEINVVVETIGGYQPAWFYHESLAKHKHVVTANKALTTHGHELFQMALENGVNLLFEASVGGGIPIIKGLKEGLIANNIESMFGILNGTSNYILTRMHQDGLEFTDALKGAQEKGFAEADPTLDISGGDAAHKLTILSSIASNSFVKYESLYVKELPILRSWTSTLQNPSVHDQAIGNLSQGQRWARFASIQRW